MRRRSRAESGQAAVETALTLPLTLFLLLGVLQLSMMLQARIVAQYAAYQAVRAGSLNKGDCRKMKQAALLALLPTITQTRNTAQLANAFAKRCSPCDAVNPGGKVSVQYDPTEDGAKAYGSSAFKEDQDSGYTEQILEIYREEPQRSYVLSQPNNEDTDFDAPRGGPGEQPIQRLEIRMLYWYRLRIPFVDWVMTRMYLAYFGLEKYTAQNPLMETQKANWDTQGDTVDTLSWPGGDPGTNMKAWYDKGHQYLFPIKVTAAMRMMTPAKGTYFSQQGCPL